MQPLAFLSRVPGLSGQLKSSPQDFVVEEIGRDGHVYERDTPYAGPANSRPDNADGTTPAPDGKFCHFVLQKELWSTPSALRAMADRMRIKPKRFDCAGNKDRQAITVQLCSAFAIEPARVLGLHLKDQKILGAWKAREKVAIGDLLGNRFTIKVDGAQGTEEEKQEKVGRITRDLRLASGNDSLIFPNYFGDQRFGGERANTAEVGFCLIRDDTKGAVMNYLCATSPNEPEENKSETGRATGESAELREARKALADTQDYAAARKAFPHHLSFEHYILAHLEAHPNDFAGALRNLSRGLQLLFIHAAQSQLFNEMLGERVREKDFAARDGEYYCGANASGFPETGKQADGNDPASREPQNSSRFLVGRLLGYETVPNELEKALLEKHGLSIESFKIKSFPELSAKGGPRALLAPLVNFEYALDTFKFSLPSGCYATVALREFLERGKAGIPG